MRCYKSQYLNSIVFVFMLLASLSARATEKERRNLLLDNYHLCMTEVSLYLFSEWDKDESLHAVESAIPHCESIRDIRQDKKNSNLSELRKTKEGYSKLDASLKTQCLQLWQQDWQHAKENDSNDAALKRFAEDYDMSRLSIINAELFYRAITEMNMTGIAVTYRDTRVPPGTRFQASDSHLPCYNPFMTTTFARMENVAFFENRRFFERLADGQIPAVAFDALWLIPQHADLDLPFQQQAIKEFRKASEQSLRHC